MLDKSDALLLTAMAIVFFGSLGMFICADELCKANDKLFERARSKNPDFFTKSDAPSIKVIMVLGMIVAGGGFLGRVGWLLLFAS